MYPQLKILLVDDEEELAIALQKVLQMEGYKVAYAITPSKALEMIKNEKYHVIITDIVLPEMDGIELLEAIKKYDPLSQVIMMTGFSTMEKTVKCLEKGASDYLLKPFTDLSQVSEAVKLAEKKLSRWWESMRGNFV